eukprot:1241214-Pleurochrysis_carterae.AAC.1
MRSVKQLAASDAAHRSRAAECLELLRKLAHLQHLALGDCGQFAKPVVKRLTRARQGVAARLLARLH